MQETRHSHKLSAREQQLLKFAAEGKTDTAIAHELGISEATVGTYWGRVRIKIGPYSRTELVATVMRAEQEEQLEALQTANSHVVEELRAQSLLDGLLSYHDLLDNAPDAMIVVKQCGTVEYANLAAMDLFGYEQQELAGLTIASLVPAQFRAVHKRHVEDFIHAPERRPMGRHMRTPALHKSGQEFLISAALSAIPTSSGMTVMCVIRPVEPT